MFDDFFKSVTDKINFNEKNIATIYPPLVLAYIGDAVYEVFIRTLLISENNNSVHNLHKRSIDFVKAKAQSNIVHRISSKLSTEENDVVRRGRNAKSNTIPKNADIKEYKYATGFEALIGFLYLKKDFERLMSILQMAVSE